MTSSLRKQSGFNDGIEYLAEVTAFYGLEAQLLDDRLFDDWLELLSKDISYQIPVRVVTKNGDEEYESGGLRVNDTFAHIEGRVKRLRTGWAWAEEPPSRVVRCVGSVLVGTTDKTDRLVSRSAVVLHRHRARHEVPDVMAYRRIDELVLDGGGILLSKRVIHMSETTLMSPNISIFL